MKDFIERSSTPEHDRYSDIDRDHDREPDRFCGKEVDATRDFDWNRDKN